MSAVTAILTGIGAGFLWCMAAIGAALLIGPRLRRRGHQAPAPADTRVPGPAPVPGQFSPERPRPPERPALAPGHDCGPAVRLAIHLGGCAYHWSPALRKWERVHHCGRTDFDTAEWERRLTL